ncbi:CD3337/EF1877 family mobilome membrane protein [Bacillus amyloliquefaciens]|uniref:CD3337/EF1877 family mobilome membrane protein n=1 Tax=Bacillus amyloliquefaciens TaxID=1390 RepID=UPI00280A43DD|nr:type IV secretion system protein [Bacillus amyloliquefaciens]MDQ8094898.1 type IV secretion system protein [Bacillus amyloliquefaciens]
MFSILASLFIVMGILSTPQVVQAKMYDPTDDLVPQESEDLPQTDAPVVRANEIPIKNYQLDVYVDPKSEDSSFWDNINIFKIPDNVSQAISQVQTTVLQALWKAYIITVNALIFLVEQAFTFDIINSMMGYIVQFITQLGGGSGIGQYMSWMLMGTAGWMVYVFAKREYRRLLSGLVVASVLSCFFAYYVSNSEDVLSKLNGYRSNVANAILTSSTYALDTSDNKDDKQNTDNENIQNMKAQDAVSVQYGLSRIRNIMHDAFIVKPWMLLEYGTTNIGMIGGASKPSDATADNIETGKKKVKQLLNLSPGSNQRKDYIKDNREDMYTSPAKTGERIGLECLMWVPALLALGFSGALSALVLCYGVVFLVAAIVGVFVLLLAVFPPFRGFAFQFFGKLIKSLANMILYTFVIVLLFSLINIIYKIGEENYWNYMQMMTAILVVLVVMLFFRKQIWGYQLARAKLSEAKKFTQEKVKERRQRESDKEKDELIRMLSSNNMDSSPAGNKRFNQQSPSHPMNRTMKAMERRKNDPVSPIKKNPHLNKGTDGQKNDAKRDMKLGQKLNKKPQNGAIKKQPNVHPISSLQGNKNSQTDNKKGQANDHSKNLVNRMNRQSDKQSERIAKGDGSNRRMNQARQANRIQNFDTPRQGVLKKQPVNPNQPNSQNKNHESGQEEPNRRDHEKRIQNMERQHNKHQI